MQSRRIAWSAAQRIEAFWSRPPVDAPAISFSAITAASISVIRPSSLPPNPSPYTSSSASAVEQVIAADELRPEPSGTHELNTASNPRTWSNPASRSAQATPIG